jgi:hypothetical protein
MKRIGIILIVIILFFTLCSCKEEKKTEYKGYNVETIQENGKIHIKTDNSQWFSNIEEIEDKSLSLSVRSWRRIFNFEIEDDKFRAVKEKALKIIVNSEINFIAGYLKTGKTEFKDVKIGRQDREKAIKLLYDGFCLIADKEGNNNGEASEEEILTLIEKYIDQYSVFYREIEVYK